MSPGGACAFLQEAPTDRCAVHRHLGPEALPVSCRQFPRVSLTDDRGTFVSLSHFCPTAARRLLDDDVPLDIVTNPRAFPADGHYEGLEARGALPPLLRPDALHSLDSYTLWETLVVGTFARADLSPERALARLAAAAERVRAWNATTGPPLVDHVRAVSLRLDTPAAPSGLAWCDPGRAARAHALVCAAVPAAHRPAVVAVGEDTWSSRVEDAWRGRTRAICRYLAARAFGTWVAYQARGARSYIAWLALALGVVRHELARAVDAGADDPVLDAIRKADLLLVHLADPQALADTVSAAESRPLPLGTGAPDVR
jgi:hypothetical protein